MHARGVVTCMIFGKEGINYNILGLANMTCMFQSSCAECRVSRAGSDADAEALLTLIKTGAENDVRKAIQTNRDRLRIVPSRGLVAVRGTKCDPNALVAVIYVGRDRADLLKRTGIAQLPSRSE